MFKNNHFNRVIVHHCLQLHFKYCISYRQLEEMMKERGVSVSHTTIYRWVMKYSAGFSKEVNWYPKNRGLFWQVEETRVKVRGRWKYLYRAIDEQCDTIDFYLSPVRDVSCIKRVLSQVLLLIKKYPIDP